MSDDCSEVGNPFAEHLDCRIRQLLQQIGIGEPPVDAILVARRLGIGVVFDATQQPRGRQVRIAGRSSIFIRPDDRAERQQWAVAHELGESLAHELFADQGEETSEISPRDREQAANLAASRLLLPTDCFLDDARRFDGDLLKLKSRYSSASHELIAFRLLDLPSPAVVTIFDQGQQTRRRSNIRGRLPPLDRREQDCWLEVRRFHRQGRVDADERRIDGWPVHEPGWQREILRTTYRTSDVEWGS